MGGVTYNQCAAGWESRTACSGSSAEERGEAGSGGGQAPGCRPGSPQQQQQHAAAGETGRGVSNMNCHGLRIMISTESGGMLWFLANLSPPRFDADKIPAGDSVNGESGIEVVPRDARGQGGMQSITPTLCEWRGGLKHREGKGKQESKGHPREGPKRGQELPPMIPWSKTSFACSWLNPRAGPRLPRDPTSRGCR